MIDQIGSTIVMFYNLFIVLYRPDPSISAAPRPLLPPPLPTASIHRSDTGRHQLTAKAQVSQANAFSKILISLEYPVYYNEFRIPSLL